MKTILFQGDSITDAGRDRNRADGLGTGYPNLVASQLGLQQPGAYRFLNKGISGNRSIDLLARVRCDIIHLKPDYMSILTGVNDVWHELEIGNGVDTKRFELYYDLLVQEVLESLPDIQIMILEPFVLKGTATEGNWNCFYREIRERAKAAMRVAKKYSLPFVPLQEVFEDALHLAPEHYWLADGVHPTAMGHGILKNEWLKAFEKMK